MGTLQLNREEYIEQAYFFRVFRERRDENLPTQEILKSIGDEILATTNLPMALDFLKGEILLTGRICDGMKRLDHYFRPFQTYVMWMAEADKSRFDQKIALQVLEREAEYLSNDPTPAGLFNYQFECIARNRIGYDGGMTAMSCDPFYDDDWRDWIMKTRLKLGVTDFADLIYLRSEHFVNEQRRKTGNSNFQPDYAILFQVQEGRIANANRGKDPLFMFAALQRHLGYPAVPRSKPKPSGPVFHPALEQRLRMIEQRMKMLEGEMKGDFDLSKFFAQPPNFEVDSDNSV